MADEMSMMELRLRCTELAERNPMERMGLLESAEAIFLWVRNGKIPTRDELDARLRRMHRGAASRVTEPEVPDAEAKNLAAGGEGA